MARSEHRPLPPPHTHTQTPTHTHASPPPTSPSTVEVPALHLLESLCGCFGRERMGQMERRGTREKQIKHEGVI